ncbi:MAG: hypothetical protein NC310_09110 [Roseburia sp.]|nr:hypothetical protein [Roseburia sp.]MCM1557909.1 hypothetical protein [Anaeroplasma bactoclasticum]
MKEEKLIPDKKLYYILSSIGLALSIVSISLVFTLDIFWLNIGLSVACIIYTVIFVIIYLKKESKEKNNIFGILGWVILIITVAFIGTAIFIVCTDETNSLPFLKVLFTAIDITPGIYLVIKFVILLVTTPGWW